MNRPLSALLGVTSAAVIATTVTAPANAATSQVERPFLFTYTFAGHLKVAGGHFTVDGRVYVSVKHSNGVTAFHKWTTARTHPVTPGGAVYVDTTLASPCSGSRNGYAEAYDAATKRWSARLPVTVCRRID
ncbi:hypothetical protein [Nonomuraea fuscirosea]|uniref:hypothetical protein n=1 Tax=Nonomuraea fuscirosea TaxID=1291556 RepID=UPI0033C1B63C